MPSNYFFVALSGLLFTMLAIFLLKMIASKHNLFITNGIPLIGGIAMAISFLSASSLGSFLFKTPPFINPGLVAPALIMLICGIFDDTKELSVFFKFFVQFLAAVALIFSGIKTKIIYLSDAANIIITLVWVIGITNAFNLLDVTDGLAAGTAFISGLSFFVLSYFSGNVSTSIILAALCGVVLGFLIYNFPPAKVYMGNAGSHFLGFLFAALAITVGYADTERRFALISPLLIMGFPIFDTLFLIFVRLKQKKPVFKKSKDHLVLRFLKIGHSRKKALFYMLSLCLFFSFSGILITKVPTYLGVVIALIVLVTSVLVAGKMDKVQVDA